MNTPQTLSFLHRLESYKWKFHLEGIRRLLREIGNPDQQLKIIHVAGTNGKGSVCAMLAEILQRSGYKVGLYTSPHLKKYNERFQINRKPISDKQFCRLVTKLKKHHTTQTFFEFTTALAFQYFAEQKVDIAVLETGLGGRLDATNVVTPLLSVITSISYEHTEYLGKTLHSIAREKAGIIKPNIPAVTSNKGTPLRVIRRIARQRRSKLHTCRKLYKEKIGLRGKFQRENAALAAKAAEILNKKSPKISKAAIRGGIANVKWPGRMDLRGNVLYDCAHNPDGVATLVDELKNMKAKRIICVFGALKDKDWRTMVSLLQKQVDFFVFTTPSAKRALPARRLAAFKQLQVPFAVLPDPREALRTAKKIVGKDLVLVTGSIYIVGELM